MTDTWAEDAPVDAPRWLTDLRDGRDPHQSRHAEVRAERIASMERDLSACRDVVTDCDRYAEFLSQFDNPCVYRVVPTIMGRRLDKLRSQATARVAQLEAELAILRRSA